jgi:hypothetical protein
MNRNEIIDSVLAQYPDASKLAKELVEKSVKSNQAQAFIDYMMHGEVMAYSSMEPLTRFELLDPADVDVR